MNIALKGVKIHNLYRDYDDEKTGGVSIKCGFGIIREEGVVSCLIQIELDSKNTGITVESFYELPDLFVKNEDKIIVPMEAAQSVYQLSYGTTRGILFAKFEVLLPLVDINKAVPNDVVFIRSKKDAP